VGERLIDAVIFDLGGVLARNGRPSDFAKRYPDHDPVTLTTLLMGDYGADTDHPWHRLERGEISLEENREHNRRALAEIGIEMPPDRPAGSTGSASSNAFVFEVNAPMVELVGELRELAPRVRLGVLTNNVREFRPAWWEMLPFEEWFDDVVDSHEVGLRKPNTAIYELALQRLDVPAGRAAFLDDVATNVTPANSLGMHGLLVEDDPSAAIAEVRRLVGLD
jgi:putative hydrolase of the HAD superfamily